MNAYVLLPVVAALAACFAIAFLLLDDELDEIQARRQRDRADDHAMRQLERQRAALRGPRSLP